MEKKLIIESLCVNTLREKGVARRRGNECVCVPNSFILISRRDAFISDVFLTFTTTRKRLAPPVHYDDDDISRTAYHPSS